MVNSETTWRRNFANAIINGWRLRKVKLDDYHLLPKKDLQYDKDLLFTYHNSDFIKEPRFAESYRLCKEVGAELLQNYDIQWRLHVLCWAASHGSKIEGDFVDCGVYTGFCARAIIHYTYFTKLPKKYWLMDTFGGLDSRYSTAYELERNDKLGYLKNENRFLRVQQTFKDFNVELIKGPIPETLHKATPTRVAFLSIDMNTAAPEIAALDYFWPRMSPGAFIVLDDYGYPGCLDQKLAHDRWARIQGVEILSLPTCQGLIIKP